MNSVQQNPKIPIQHLEAFETPAMARIPKNIWIMIFCKLATFYDLESVSLTCKHWHVIASRDIIWKSLILKLWPNLSSFEFKQPKAFVSSQFSLIERTFIKAPKETEFSSSKLGISIFPKPCLIKNEYIFSFLEEKDGSTLCYAQSDTRQSPPLVVKRCSEKWEPKQGKCDFLDLSPIIGEKDEVSVKEIQIVGEMIIFHIDHAIYFPPENTIVFFGQSTEKEDEIGSTLVFINRSTLSIIGHICSPKEQICSSELSENRDLRIFKKGSACPEIYNLKKKNHGFWELGSCKIF